MFSFRMEWSIVFFCSLTPGHHHQTIYNFMLHQVSYVAHLAGFAAGLLLGMVTLRNLKEHRWEIALKWTGLAVFLALIAAAVAIQVAYPDLVGLYPPMPDRDVSGKLLATNVNV